MVMQRFYQPQRGGKEMERAGLNDLVEVMIQMPEVVLGEIAQRDGRLAADTARHLQLAGREMRDDVRQKAIVVGPKRDQGRPGRVFESLHARPVDLVVSGEVERIGQRGADESLVV